MEVRKHMSDPSKPTQDPRIEVFTTSDQRNSRGWVIVPDFVDSISPPIPDHRNHRIVYDFFSKSVFLVLDAAHGPFATGLALWHAHNRRKTALMSNMI